MAGSAALAARATSSAGDVWPCCLATGATPGSGVPSGAVARGGVADHEHLGMAGHRKVGADLHAAGAVGLGAEPAARRRRHHAGGPDDRARRDAIAAEADAVATRNPSPPRRAAPRRRAAPASAAPSSDSARSNGVSSARRGLDQDDAGAARIDGAEVGGKRALRKLGDGAGHLDAGRAAADHHEGQQPSPLLGVGLGLGALEGEQDAAAQIGGVVDRLQTRRERAPSRRGRNRRAARRSRGPDSRRRPAGPSAITSLRAVSTPVTSASMTAGVALARAGCRGSARRCRPARGPPSRPDRAAAGTGDGCCGRSA